MFICDIAPMKDIHIGFFFFIVGTIGLLGQQELNYPYTVYPATGIKANWVSHPEVQGTEETVLLFRNTFDLSAQPDKFIINISADNHYFLYVNERLVTHGPQLSDIRHWKYETLDLKNYLHKGKNVIAVKVIQFGKRRFLGMQSIFTTFLVNGVTPNARIVNTTGDNDAWRCKIDQSYQAMEVNWRGPGEKSIIGGFYANNPTDFVDMNSYPTGWKSLEYDDQKWQRTVFFEGASSMGGSIAYMLEPRNLPLLTWEAEEVGEMVRASKGRLSSFPMSGELVVAPNSKAIFLLDKNVVTNGFPTLSFSQGKDAVIDIKYAENLFGRHQVKGDRNIIKDKKLYGYYDRIVSNGKPKQEFTPNWMRTFRFIEIEVNTNKEALILHQFQNHRSRTTLPSIAKFTSDNSMYNAIFEICKRTIDICTQDYFLSDAYYETMQYVGDTKIQALMWQLMSGNMDHTKNAIKQFDHSRDAEGNILGAYPLRSTFIYPTYSLIYVDMVADYVERTGDIEFAKRLLPGVAFTLAGFEQNMNAQNLVKKTPYRYFVDWYKGPNDGKGTATNNDGENSAVVTLHYVHALQSAAYLFNKVGKPEQARGYLQRAAAIQQSVNQLCFDVDRGLYAERPDKTVYDQHTNIMAVLTDTYPEKDQKGLLTKIVKDSSLLQASYYYRYYLMKAIEKASAPELFDLAQKPWEKMIGQHMSTTLERFEYKNKPTRSEVHPWSASPPLFYFGFLAGIRSLSDNYAKIRVAPQFGVLNQISGTLPTPRGNIEFELKKKEQKLQAYFLLPKGCNGTLVWNGKEVRLYAGENQWNLN